MKKETVFRLISDSNKEVINIAMLSLLRKVIQILPSPGREGFSSTELYNKS